MGQQENGTSSTPRDLARPAWAAALEETQRRANERRTELTAEQRRRERRERTLVAGWLRELTRRP